MVLMSPLAIYSIALCRDWCCRHFQIIQVSNSQPISSIPRFLKKAMCHFFFFNTCHITLFEVFRHKKKGGEELITLLTLWYFALKRLPKPFIYEVASLQTSTSPPPKLTAFCLQLPVPLYYPCRPKLAWVPHKVQSPTPQSLIFTLLALHNTPQSLRKGTPRNSEVVRIRGCRHGIFILRLRELEGENAWA
jgi:hypothetical protein